MEIVELTKENFYDYVTNSTKPVLIDFWASWCGPCRMLAPVFEEIAEEIKNDAMTAKVNVDDNVDIANQYQIAGIPTVAVFQNGAITARRTGMMSKQDILQLLAD